ncbi:uncharacterized protein LOC132940616 [Metopolophium dirhodum]|uniref:uncharacterized protein LOC132940616 n=1 Tax=Metopolophium dirhodum TaxID=44670 RepID=UPI0029901C67|nr:uncharacterized protein LOC132940616 [Metopolophium dirhodum]
MLEIINLNQIDSNQTKDLFCMFDELSNTFSYIKSEHLRFKMFDKMGVLIRPKMVEIGYRLNDKLRNGRVIFEPKTVTMSFIPLRSVLKILFQDCNLFHVILEFMNHLDSSSMCSTISNFVQFQLWQSKLKKNPGKILIPLFLYFDDFEINNALGSHAGTTKLGAVYVSLPCLPPDLASSLENIFLVQLFKSNDRQEFGNQVIFAELISELNFIENVGIDILYNGEMYRVFFSLGLILGDNLGLHSILGFTESFVAQFPCRFCKSPKLDCHHQVTQVDGVLRNKTNYDEDISINNITLTGLKELCVFNQINSFHVTQNFAVDIMHDILEGDLVPLNSEIWCLYISLRQIIGILLEKSIKYDDIDLCKTLITEHHELYMNLFNTNLKPKFHHMVHYPMVIKNCGPLSLIWSMRFESKHKELKETAKSITSRKNACYTLALKHQLNVAYRILSTKNKLIVNKWIKLLIITSAGARFCGAQGK